MNKYSVVFMPDTQTIELVKSMKMSLAAKCGSFKSKNALAHFTIFEFFEKDEIEHIFCKQFERIASEIHPFKMICDAFNSYDNGAFFIKPNKESELIMKTEMKNILKQITSVKKEHQSTEPHLTIGRQLNLKQLKIAKEMFQEIDISFPVTHLILRKFNPLISQYEIYKKFPLLGKPKETQGILF